MSRCHRFSGIPKRYCPVPLMPDFNISLDLSHESGQPDAGIAFAH
jgi:hypothetical protein